MYDKYNREEYGRITYFWGIITGITMMIAIIVWEDVLSSYFG